MTSTSQHPSSISSRAFLRAAGSDTRLRLTMPAVSKPLISNMRVLPGFPNPTPLSGLVSLFWLALGLKPQPGGSHFYSCLALCSLFTLRGRAMPERLNSGMSLGVTLRAQPRDTALSIHPIVDICLAFESGNFQGFD